MDLVFFRGRWFFIVREVLVLFLFLGVYGVIGKIYFKLMGIDIKEIVEGLGDGVGR